MKILLSSFCLLFIPLFVFSQRTTIASDEYGNQMHYTVTGFKSKMILNVTVDKNTKFISPFNQLPNDSLGRMMFLVGTETATVTARLRKDSLSYYRYSIIENDTVVKVWNEKLTKVSFVWNERSSWPGFLTMDFGVSNIKGKKITVKFYRLPKVEEVSTVVIYNKSLPKPKLSKALFWSRNGKPHRYDYLALKGGEHLKLTDSAVGIFITKPKTDIDFIQRVLLKYKKDGKTYTRSVGNNWRYNGEDGEPTMLIEPINFSSPGEYELLLQNYVEEYRGFKSKDPVSILKFTVAQPPTQFSTIEVLAVVFAVCGVAVFALLLIRRSNKKKQIQLSLKAEAAKSELNAVRAQLNPHFVFNALSGIQNLMNNNAIEQANNYLGKFANLTRQILDDRELITIEDEVKLLKDYLSMEQLRFPFAVQFNIDKHENITYTEIPTMLLQPFVENAVKHGVASQTGRGEIIVDVFKEQQNIVLMVKDNGKGFERSADSKGLGLKLSEKRIALLNENYKTCPIELNINSSSGTTIRITLTNWLT
ncbi:MAG: histidine kinase [Bacteroidota bacterium]